MEQVTLAFQERSDLKKTASRRLRDSGRIPAVVYGQGTAVPISVEAHEFAMKFSSFGENSVLKLQNGKKVYEVLVKDYQDSLLSGKVQHIDFYHVSATKLLHAKVPVKLSGSAIGVRNGGLMEHAIHEIEVECLAKDIPHEMIVDVSKLEIGGSIHVRDLQAAKGVRIVTNAEAVVAHVISAHSLGSAESAAEPVAEAAAPAAKATEKKA